MVYAMFFTLYMRRLHIYGSIEAAASLEMLAMLDFPYFP